MLLSNWFWISDDTETPLESLFYHSESRPQCGGIFRFAAQIALRPAARRGFDQPRAADSHTSAGQSQRANTALGEMGFRRSLMKMAAFGKVGERVRLEREAVLWRPFAARIAAKQDAVIAV